MKIFKKEKIKEFLLISLGVFLMAGAYSIFLDANNLIAGGVGGIATILKNVFDGIKIFGITISSSVFILIMNGILLVAALIFIGKEFFLKTAYASIAYPVFTFIWSIINEKVLVNYLPNLTKMTEQFNTLGNDFGKVATVGAYLLIIIFGAVIASIGLGIALKNGASTGGTDILQRICLDYFKMPYSFSMVLIDGIIVTCAAIFFKDIYVILYGVLFIYLSGAIVDSIVFSGFSSRAVNIVTTKKEEIIEEIFKVLGRGVTILEATGGYTNEAKAVLVCVMANSEFYRMKEVINKIDEKAFIYVTRASEVHGEGFTYEPREGKNNDKR